MSEENLDFFICRIADKERKKRQIHEYLSKYENKLESILKQKKHKRMWDFKCRKTESKEEFDGEFGYGRENKPMKRKKLTEYSSACLGDSNSPFQDDAPSFLHLDMDNSFKFF
jgi:hypothetical protein